MFDKINCKPATTLKQEKWNIQFVTSVNRDIEKTESLTGIKPMTFRVLVSGTLTTELLRETRGKQGQGHIFYVCCDMHPAYTAGHFEVYQGTQSC